MKIRPLQDRIIVKRIEEEETTDEVHFLRRSSTERSRCMSLPAANRRGNLLRASHYRKETVCRRCCRSGSR